MITLRTAAGADHDVKATGYQPGWFGHYHLACIREIDARLAAIAEEPRSADCAAALAQIPTAKQWQIDNYRDVHRLPDGRRRGLLDDDLRAVVERVARRCAYTLPRAGVRSLADAAAMTDEQLLAIPGVGPKTLQALRAGNTTDPSINDATLEA